MAAKGWKIQASNLYLVIFAHTLDEFPGEFREVGAKVTFSFGV